MSGRQPRIRVEVIGDIEEMFSRAHEATKGLSTLGPRWNEMVRSSAANSRAFGEALRGVQQLGVPPDLLRSFEAAQRANALAPDSGRVPAIRREPAGGVGTHPRAAGGSGPSPLGGA